VWKISEGPDEEDKPQITGKAVVAIQITGEEGATHPRVCWHCHKQVIIFISFCHPWCKNYYVLLILEIILFRFFFWFPLSAVKLLNIIFLMTFTYFYTGNFGRWDWKTNSEN
jgi:hypothetical protein